MDTNKEQLNQYIFNYNSHSDEWRAVKRDNYLELFSNNDSKNILKSKKIEVLIEYITKNQ